MDRRLELHKLLIDILGEIRDDPDGNVYYQPPDGARLTYPCIVYKMCDLFSIHANNRPYHLDKCYQITLITRTPDPANLKDLAELPTCRYERFFVVDNLNHYVFRLYY